MLLTAILVADLAALCAVAAAGNGEGKGKIVTLFNFTEAEPRWRVIDDGVMGGLSQGSWAVSDGRGVFAGTLSLENNGGFSSVRSQPFKSDCTGGTAVQIRVKGDGRRYQFRARTTNTFDGVSYRAFFETVKDEWKEITLPFEAFEPSFRGRVLTGRPPLEGKDLVTVGFLLADKKAGPFRLEVDWIKVVKPGE